MTTDTNRTRLFISYSRKDIEFVEQLVDALKKHDYFADYDLGGDYENIEGGIAPTDLWWEKLKDNISKADVVVFVVSPDSSKSKICDDEIAWAQQLSKRLIPIVWRPINLGSAPERLAALNLAIPFSTEASTECLPFINFSSAFNKLCVAIDKDIDWLREGRRLLTLAHQWHKDGRPDAQLLRLEAVNAAEAWAARRPKNANQPAELLLTFLKASREKELADRIKLRRTIGRAFVGPAKQSMKESRYENAIRLIGAGVVLSEDPNFKLVPELWPMIPQVIFERRVRTVLRGHDSSVYVASWSKDGVQILTSSGDGTSRIWNVDTGEEIVCLKGHDKLMSTAEWSPDGSTVVTASSNNRAILWDASTGKVRYYLVHQSSVWIVHFSPDGSKVLSISDDGTARVWDSESGRLLTMFAGHGGPFDGYGMPRILSGAFSLDNQLVITTATDAMARIWNSTSGAEIAVLEGHTGDVMDASFSPDGNYVATCACDGTIRIWKVNQAEEIFKFKAQGKGEFVRISWDYEGKRILAGSTDNSAQIWEVDKGQRITICEGHSDQVISVSWSFDGCRVLTTSSDNTARIWSAYSGKELLVLAGHEAAIWTAAFSPNGQQVVTASDDGTARIWDAAISYEIGQASFHEEGILSLEISSDKRFFVTSSLDRTALVIESETGNIISNLKGHKRCVRRATFSPDGKNVATASDDGTAILWDTMTGNLVTQAKPKMNESTGNMIHDIAYSPDGSVIALGCHDQTVRFWDRLLKKEIVLIKVYKERAGQDPYVNRIAWSPDGKKLIAATEHRDVWMWDTTTGKELGKLVGHTSHVRSACFSPDGGRIVTASNDDTIRIWNAANYKEILRFKVPCSRGSFYDLSAIWSPDGRRIVTTSNDKVVRVWDALSGVELISLIGHSDNVTRTVFTPDGRFIVSTSFDQTIRLWDVTLSTVFKGDRGSLLAGGLANGVGYLSKKETSDILLEDAPPNLFSALMSLMPDRSKDIKRVIDEIKMPIHPNCYIEGAGTVGHAGDSSSISDEIRKANLIVCKKIFGIELT